jgi:hypothetical protein
MSATNSVQLCWLCCDEGLEYRQREVLSAVSKEKIEYLEEYKKELEQEVAGLVEGIE